MSMSGIGVRGFMVAAVIQESFSSFLYSFAKHIVRESTASLWGVLNLVEEMGQQTQCTVKYVMGAVLRKVTLMIVWCITYVVQVSQHKKTCLEFLNIFPGEMLWEFEERILTVGEDKSKNYLTGCYYWTYLIYQYHFTWSWHLLLFKTLSSLGFQDITLSCFSSHFPGSSFSVALAWLFSSSSPLNLGFPRT